MSQLHSNQRNNSNSNPTKAADNILNYPPLYKKHLQPSSAPPSIGSNQLKLFQQVLSRRLLQLSEFSLDTHKALYKQLTIGNSDNSKNSNNNNNSSSSNNTQGKGTRNTDKNQSEIPITATEINQLFKLLPNKKPTEDKDDYISLLNYLLTENFHSSSDNRLDTSHRSHCLQKVKFILLRIDEAHREHIDSVKNQSEKAQAATSTKATTSAEAQQQKKDNMGARGSKPISNSSNDKEIIYLDDDDEDEEEGEQQCQQQQAEKHKIVGKSNANKDANAKTNVARTAAAKSKRATDSPKNKNSSSTIRNSSKPQAVSTNKTLESASTVVTKPPPSSTKQTFIPSSTIPPSQEYIPSYIQSKSSLYLKTPYINQPNLQTFTFLPDQKVVGNFTVSNSLSDYERSRCEITINTAFETCKHTIAKIKSTPIPPPHISSIPHTSIFLDGLALDDLGSRLRKWDPYWRVICNCSTFYSRTSTGDELTPVGYKTTNIVAQRLDFGAANNDPNAMLRTSCVIPIQLKNLFSAKHLQHLIWNEVDWGVSKAGNSTSYNNIKYKDKEKRLIVRALPLVPNPKYKKLRADTHQWPKGTFVQLDSKVIHVLAQRKQQQHDPKLWKGLSAVLDLTEHLSIKDMSDKFHNNMPMNLSFCLKDGEMYGIQIALCEFISHKVLFDVCMSRGTKGSIAKMSYKDGLKHAMKHFEKETLVLDSDSEDESDYNRKASSSKSINDGSNGKGIPNLTCSLLCPVSMRPIQTPARGKACKHLSCFDLETFLENNSKVSGGRWRCFICEDFISVCDLVYDGFIAQVLETHRNDISSTRDKLELSNDGTWKLFEETATSSMRRTMKRKMKNTDDVAKKSRTNEVGEAEVIDIDG